LNHPRIVRVYELIETADDLTLVLEYVEGMDLSRAMPELDQSSRIQVLADVADALEHAATAGIVHRDIKPANVLIDMSGRAKLTDFGIARLSRSARAFRTGGSAAAGTPRYVAPEQLMDPDHESPAADAYSFAVMAYEMVVGHPPFKADTSEALIFAHMALPPIPPRDHAPLLSDDAAHALLAGLSKNPAERPRPQELVERLVADADLQATGPHRPAQRSTQAPAAPTGSNNDRALVGHNQIPWTDPSPFRPPLPRRSKTISVSPFAIGALVALAVIIIVLFVL
jgi:serine/threonine-protein kinase